jgi:transposase-like protein
MTPERREAARQMLDSGHQVAQVARTLGVGRATIYRYVFLASPGNDTQASS